MQKALLGIFSQIVDYIFRFDKRYSIRNTTDDSFDDFEMRIIFVIMNDQKVHIKTNSKKIKK